MTDPQRALLLRFRDLVTEAGGTIAEHRRVLRQHGHVWWGWWARQSEDVPRSVLAELFVSDSRATVPILLFDSGFRELHQSTATGVAVAPSVVGIHSPELSATPDYYARGQYPAWFRLEGDIDRIDASELRILARPTVRSGQEGVRPDTASEGPFVMSLEELQDDRPTLWVVQLPE